MESVRVLLQRVRREMLRSLVDILQFEPGAIDYLAPMANLARDQGGLTIATLNYDRTVEELAAREGISCDTGIDTWLSRGS